MSFSLTQLGIANLPDNSSVPLADDSRVRELIERHAALPALRAYSELQRRNRDGNWLAASTGKLAPAADQTLADPILHDALQLLCERMRALTWADAVTVVLAEGPDLVCRAASGTLPIKRNARLNGASHFLKECLESGQTLRCDDSQADARLAHDLARAAGARSTVLVPLLAGSYCLGVLQAFTAASWSFTDEDVQCIELFAELILGALRPDAQDRRFHWLQDVASQVLLPKPAFLAIEEIVGNYPPPSEAGEAAAKGTVTWETAFAGIAHGEVDSASPSKDENDDQPCLPVPISQPAFQPRQVNFGASINAHPGLAVVFGMVAVAALFSAGVWWGMLMHERTASARREARNAITQIADAKLDGSKIEATGSMAALSSIASAADDSTLESNSLSPIAQGKLAALPKITSVRHWSSSNGSTVVIDMEDQVPYEVHRLTSPERIYFDLHDTALASDLENKTMEVGDTSLARVQVTQPVAGVTRVLLDTRGGSNFSVSLESDPYRLVVELRDGPKSPAASQLASTTPFPGKPDAAAMTARTSPEHLPVQPLSAKPLGTQPLPELPLIAKTGKLRIVVDAGHGGWDLGTVGRKGLLEKDLVLDVAERLGKMLRDRMGSEVMFTRTSDDYVPLEQRAEIANRAQADLFVSVHANYSASASARGVETYYTNQFSAPTEGETAAPATGRVAQPASISLSADALRDKTEESRRLAASVQRALYATLATRSPDIRDRGIKDAAFIVLTGTTMPAILTEISFVSSPTDEKNLQSETYRQQIAEALYKGIARYEESSPRAKVAQLQPVAPRR